MGKSIQNSTRELANLEFLSGQLETMDGFALLYKTMLDECQATGDQEMLRAMQQILFKQGAFLTDEWVKGKLATKDQPPTLSIYPMGSMN